VLSLSVGLSCTQKMQNGGVQSCSLQRHRPSRTPRSAPGVCLGVKRRRLLPKPSAMPGLVAKALSVALLCSGCGSNLPTKPQAPPTTHGYATSPYGGVRDQYVVHNAPATKAKEKCMSADNIP